MHPSIFSLSSELRQRVYFYADLIPNAEDYLELSNHINLPGRWLKTADLHTARSLLLTCKAFYHDVSAILYTQGRFILRVRRINDLAILHRLRPSTIRNLRFLTVHLRITSCLPHPYEPCCRDGQPSNYYQHLHDTALDLTVAEDQELLLAWSDAIRYVLNNVKLGQFHFSLVTDGSGVECAVLASQALTGYGHLASSAIRLSRCKHEVLGALARKTALQMMGQQSDEDRPFRYLDLPLEIRRKILQFTDLVTPLNEVEWSPRRGFQLRYYLGSCEAPFCPPDYHHACQFRECWTRFGDGGCFCQRYHSAYSSNCRCWAPPTPIFLVCRTLRDEAEEIFYWYNRIVIVPLDDIHSLPRSNPVQFEASVFLRTIRQSALRHLRFLEIVFPPFEDGYCIQGSSVHTDWQAVIALLQDEDLPALPMLTVRIYFANFPLAGNDVGRYHAQMRSEQAKTVLMTYIRILTPIANLSQLRRFYFHLTYPTFWIASLRRRCEVDGSYDHVEEKTHQLEETLGRNLLKDRFRTLTYGEDAQWARESQWLLEYDRGSYGGHDNPLLR